MLHDTKVSKIITFQSFYYGTNYFKCFLVLTHLGFSGGSAGKESACKAGDTGLIPGSGRSPGEGNDYPLQFSCLDDSMDKEALRAVVHEVTRVRHD